MSSKIRVDPRTFKIINQEKSIESKTESDTFTTDSESSTSINSDTNSVKVIKLDDSVQSGGKGQLQIQSQPQIQVKKIENPLKTSSFSPINNNLPPQPPPQPSQQPLPQPLTPLTPQQPLPPPQPPLQLPQSEQKRMEERYLRTDDSTPSSIESSVSESSDGEKESKGEGEEIVKENSTVEQNGSTDVIDLTKSQLHDVLYSIFTDVAGDNISENIVKMSKLFEAHNQIMEKILNQLIIMNSNCKQVTVPVAMQTNTKKVDSLNDFRKNTTSEN
jgi:hypothetical protein